MGTCSYEQSKDKKFSRIKRTSRRRVAEQTDEMKVKKVVD